MLERVLEPGNVDYNDDLTYFALEEVTEASHHTKSLNRKHAAFLSVIASFQNCNTQSIAKCIYVTGTLALLRACLGTSATATCICRETILWIDARGEGNGSTSRSIVSLATNPYELHTIAVYRTGSLIRFRRAREHCGVSSHRSFSVSVKSVVAISAPAS